MKTFDKYFAPSKLSGTFIDLHDIETDCFYCYSSLFIITTGNFESPY